MCRMLLSALKWKTHAQTRVHTAIGEGFGSQAAWAQALVPLSLSVWPLASPLTFLSSSFFIYNIQMITGPILQGLRKD